MAISLKKQIERAEAVLKTAALDIYAAGGPDDGFNDCYKKARDVVTEAYDRHRRVLVALQFEAVSKGRAYWQNASSFTGFTWTK